MNISNKAFAREIALINLKSCRSMVDCLYYSEAIKFFDDCIKRNETELMSLEEQMSKIGEEALK